MKGRPVIMGCDSFILSSVTLYMTTEWKRSSSLNNEGVKLLDTVKASHQ